MPVQSSPYGTQELADAWQVDVRRTSEKLKALAARLERVLPALAPDARPDHAATSASCFIRSCADLQRYDPERFELFLQTLAQEINGDRQ